VVFRAGHIVVPPASPEGTATADGIDWVDSYLYGHLMVQVGIAEWKLQRALGDVVSTV
jgi:hypothetical protein